MTSEPGGPLLPPRAAEPEISEDAVVRATGRGWDDWLRILDARGVEGFSHRDTAAWLRTELGVDGWWAQAITVGFERARGLRAPNQVADGFSVGVSKTIPVPAGQAWAAFATEDGRSRWLAPGLLRLRTAQPGRSARFDVAGDSSRVAAHLVAKGDAKTAVTVQHERLASAAEVEERRAFWRDRLTALGDLLRGEELPASVAAPPAAGTPPAGARDEFLAAVDPASGPLIVELDRLVRAAAPGLDAAVKYRMLTYAIRRDWWRWVVAIGVTKRAVNLRLLYGTRLTSGVGVLRPGSSHLATLDLAPDGPLDPDLVTRLVREAVERHPEFLAAEGIAKA